VETTRDVILEGLIDDCGELVAKIAVHAIHNVLGRHPPTVDIFSNYIGLDLIRTVPRELTSDATVLSS